MHVSGFFVFSLDSNTMSDCSLLDSTLNSSKENALRTQQTRPQWWTRQEKNNLLAIRRIAVIFLIIEILKVLLA